MILENYNQLLTSIYYNNNFIMEPKNHLVDPVSHKIDFKALWPHCGHADSLGVKNRLGDNGIKIKVKWGHLLNPHLVNLQ